MWLFRFMVGYLGVMVLALGAGIAQAIWLGAHNRDAMPSDTIGGVIAMAMLFGAVLMFGISAIWFAIRGPR